MLREHGTQRPSVFEILDHVHRLRGTQSRFTYAIPPREPPLSPRSMAPPLQALSPNIVSPTPLPNNPLDDLVSYKSQQPLSVSPSKGAGIAARDKVLEAIAPMRRGRPAAGLPMPSPPTSPKKERRFDLDSKFTAEEDRAWRAVRGHKSGLASIGGTNMGRNKPENGDAWVVGPRLDSKEKAKGADRKAFEQAFGDDFSTGFDKSFGDSFQSALSPAPAPSPRPQRSPQPQVQYQPSPSPNPPLTTQLGRRQSIRKPKDAFDGLGLAAAPPPQTLGEARKTRTGMASIGISPASSAATQYLNAPSSQASGLGTSNTMYRPPSAHSTFSNPSPQPASQFTLPPVQPLRTHSKAPSSVGQRAAQGESLSAEQRFPSLEELDREFASPPPVTSPGSGSSAQAPGEQFSAIAGTEKFISGPGSRPSSRASYMRGTPVDGLPGASVSGVNATGTGAMRGKYDGLRSQNVTGAGPMARESRYGGLSRQPSTFARANPLEARREAERQRESERPRETENTRLKETEKDVVAVLRSRPSAARRHKHSSGGKTPSRGNSIDLLSSNPAESSSASLPTLPPRPQPGTRVEPRDWLTGMDEDEPPLPIQSTRADPQPVLRESPSKRASYIERSPIVLQKPLEAESVLGTYREPEKAQPNRGVERERAERQRRSPERTKGLVARTGTGTKVNLTGTSHKGLKLPPVDTKTASRSGVKSSPNGLTENWSPIAASSEHPTKSPSSSSSEEEPEDLQGYAAGRHDRRTRESSRTGDRTGSAVEDKRRRARSKGRQSSVHDLVDLWGANNGPAAVPQEPRREREKSTGASTTTRQADKRRSVIMPAPSARPPLGARLRAESPAPLIDTSISSVASRLPTSQVPPPASPHRRQPSNVPGARHTPAPSAVPTPMLGRSRPQSMFVTSLSKTASTDTNASTSSATTHTSSATSTGQLLSPPPDPQSRRASRRSSISDMVQRFEAIGSSTKGPGTLAPPPGPAPKPAGLSTKGGPTPILASTSVSSSGGGDVPSPSAAAARFPRLSPTTSPVMFRANLAVPDDAGQGRGESARERRAGSPAAGLPSRASPVGRSEGAAAVNGLPGRRSPLSFARGADTQERPASPFPLRKAVANAPLAAPAPAEEQPSPVRSPSPERPYQGVSKLIDRWNRAVDDTGAVPGVGPKKGGFPVRRAGVVGDSGHGR